MQRNTFFILLFIPFLLGSCSSSTEQIMEQLSQNKRMAKGIVIDNPVNMAVFPPEMSAPCFRWRDTLYHSQNWQIIIGDTLAGNLVQKFTQNPFWKPSPDEWEKIKCYAQKHPVKVTIIGTSKSLFPGRVSCKQIWLNTSADSVNASIFFRAVPLPFSFAVKHVDQIKWYMSGIADTKPNLMLENMPVCANCHSFDASGSQLAMDVDYANDKGSYAIVPANRESSLDFDHIITWSDYQKYDGEDTYGLLSQISPDGKNVVSTVKDRSVFVALNDLRFSQLFFPVKGILANYNCISKQFTELPGANDRNFVQSNPSWSPDGEKIVFARAPRYISEKIDEAKTVLLSNDDAAEFITGKKDFKFDLYQLAYNQGKGGIAQPLQGGANNNKSNYFARYSPNGRWIVFCQANNFMLLQPDSKLYIMPAQGGQPRLMQCNTSCMNSWHSWSPNSHWLVFSSKKEGAYTKIYLTHIDSNGYDSPPVLLENMNFDSLSVNIPEFYPGNPNQFNSIVDHFSQTAGYYSRMASQCIRSNDFAKALQHLAKAIELDPEYYEAYLLRIKVNELLHQANQLKFKEDITHANTLLLKALKADPDNPDIWQQRISFLLLTKQFAEAQQVGKQVLKKFPGNCGILNLVSSLYRLNGQYSELIPLYNLMLSDCRENDKQTRLFLAIAWQRIGNQPKALEVINPLIEKFPTDYTLLIARAGFFNEAGKIQETLNDLNHAVQLNPENYQPYKARMDFYLATNQKERASNDRLAVLQWIEKDMNRIPNTQLLFERAAVYESWGEYQAALNDYKTILTQWPDNYMALKQKAKLALTLNDAPTAFELYRQLLEKYPAEAGFYNNLGLISVNSNKSGLALGYFTKALQMEPDNLDILYNRAYYYYNNNDKNNAINDLKQLQTLLAKPKPKTLNDAQWQQLQHDVKNMLVQLNYNANQNKQ